MSTLITTTVCVDAQKPATQMIIHLSKGDAGTRTLRMIPVEGGAAVDMANVAQAKVMAHPSGTAEDLLLNCTLGDNYADMVPTAALVANAETWAAQLVLLDDDNQTLKSLPFTIIIHGSVYDGDTVEHTNKSVMSIEWNQYTRTISLVLADGSRITKSLDHEHPYVSTEQDGFLLAQQYSDILDMLALLNQDVKTTASPTFAGLVVGDVVISGDGTMTGVRFT